MQFKLSLFSVVLSTQLFPAVYGTGINCDGSSSCGFAPSGTTGKLANLLSGVNPSRWYSNGEQIGCSGNSAAPVCAFLQKSGGASGATIKQQAHYIPDHGCGKCGSVPLNYPQGNNVEDGELTFNFVYDYYCQIGTLC